MTGDKLSQFERNRGNPEYRAKALEATRRWRERHKNTPEYKEKVKEKAARYYEKNKRKIKHKQMVKYHSENGKSVALNVSRKRRYGLSKEGFDTLLAEQGGVCAICKGDNSQSNRQWHVDHCHNSLKVRGILCHGCNTALGMMKEDITTLTNAITYLTR